MPLALFHCSFCCLLGLALRVRSKPLLDVFACVLLIARRLSRLRLFDQECHFRRLPSDARRFFYAASQAFIVASMHSRIEAWRFLYACAARSTA